MAIIPNASNPVKRSEDQEKGRSLRWSLIFTSLVTIIGWGIVGGINSHNERKNKLRDIKISYLIDAYRKMANASNRDMHDGSYHRDIEAAISDIQLFGTKSQIVKLTEAIAKTKFTTGLVELNMDPILNDIRNSLRQEIDLDEIETNVQWFRFHENADSTIPHHNQKTLLK